MNMIVQLSQDLYLQLRAFVRSIADECHICMRRNMGYCAECRSSMAGVLGKRMDEDLPPRTETLDTSLDARIGIILAALRKAKTPLRAVDIDTRDYCSKELKRWTLNKMISQGKIKRRKVGFFHVYELVEPTKNKKGK